MRNLTLSAAFLFGIVMLSSLCGCKKQADKPAVDQLPAATQYGANTFGCLVNGKVFIPKVKFGSLSPALNSYYQYIYSSTTDGYVFQVAANNKSDLSVLYSVNLGFDSLQLEEGKTYQLKESGKGHATGNYSEYTHTSLNDYFTYSPSSGELTITHLDETYQIVSGTFWFTAVDKNGDSVKITDAGLI